MMTFVIFRKQCKMMSQFQKWVNTKFCLYDWASQAHRCTINPLIHPQLQNLFCLLFLLVMVPKEQSPTISMNSAIPTKTDYTPSYITGRLGFYFVIVILSKFPFSTAIRLSSSSVGATTLGGFWPALRFCSTIFYLYTSLSSFSLSSSLNPLLLGQAISNHNHNPFHALVVFFCICRNYYLQPSQQRKFFQGAVASRRPNPLPRRTGVSLLVWAITFDLSGKGDPTSSYATAGVALRIIWPLKPSHYFKVETPSGGQLGYHTYIMYGLIE